MHDTIFIRSDGSLQQQYMVFQPCDIDWDTGEPISADLIGKAKGIKRVLQERGLWVSGLKKQCGRQKKDNTRTNDETMGEYNARIADRCEAGKSCCALRILEAQQDFQEEKSMLEHIITAAGHEVIFYPKFHCELNYIEYSRLFL